MFSLLNKPPSRGRFWHWTVMALQLLPLLGATAGRLAAAQEIIVARCFAQALPQADRSIVRSGS